MLYSDALRRIPSIADCTSSERSSGWQWSLISSVSDCASSIRSDTVRARQLNVLQLAGKHFPIVLIGDSGPQRLFSLCPHDRERLAHLMAQVAKKFYMR